MAIRGFVNLSLALIATASLFSQQSSNKGTTTFYPAKPINPLPPPPPMMAMPLVSPLFLEGGHFSSVLALVNNSEADTYADLTVRGLDGSAIATRRISFSPHSQRRVQLSELLAGTASGVMAGSVLIMQSSTLAGPSIAAAMSMTYSGSADPNYIDEEISMPKAEGSQALEGVADRANGSPVVAISSVSGSAQHINVQCIGERGVIASNQVDLGGGMTIISDVCSGRDVHGTDFHAVLGRDDDASHGPLGIKLTSDAMPGSFAAFALAPHRESGDHFFSSVLFTDPMMTNSPNTVFTGIPVGSANLLPDGNYTPRISLTNFSTAEIHAQIEFARTFGETPQSVEVGSLTIPAGTSRELVLKGIEGDPGLQNSFVLRSDGAPGALMAKLVSASESRLHEVELQAKDASDVENAGNHPWSIEANTESTLLLFNHSASPQNFDIWIAGGNIQWQKTYKLAPMQTKAIGIREIVENQLKDDKGKMLPKTVQSGEINWMDVNPNKGSGRLLQSDRSAGMARNFSCGYSGLLCGSNVTIYQSYLPDGTVIDYADIVPITCTSGTQNACSGQRTGSGGSFSYSWSSGTPSVASISGSSISSNVNLLGVSLGTSNVNGQVRSQYCMSGGGGPVSTICSIAKLIPSIFNPTNCNGGANTGVIQAQLAPSASQCYWTPSQSTCAVQSKSGSVDIGSGGCTISTDPTSNPSGSFQYFAGPGSSGQIVGSIAFGFDIYSPTHGGSTGHITQSTVVNVQCP